MLGTERVSLARDESQGMITYSGIYLRPAEIFIQNKNQKELFKMHDLYPEPITTFYRALQTCCSVISIQ